MNTTLSNGMGKSAKSLLNNLSGSHLLIGLNGSPDSVAGWGEVNLANWRFPWNRAFEVRMDISAGDLTKASDPFLKTLFSN